MFLKEISMKKVLRAASVFLLCAGVLAGCHSGTPEMKTDESGKNTEEAMMETETTAAPEYPAAVEGIYSMKSLEQWAKFHNRHYFLRDGSMAADWSASGFTMNVNAKGGDFDVYYKADYEVYLSIMVDGEEAARPKAETGEGHVSVFLSEGIHEVSVYKETEINPKGKGFNFAGIAFEGEILEKPADAPLFIEYIGDSIACGDGSLGVYTSGEVWKNADHSATHGFPFLLSKMLGADYSIVAKGGIGLLKPSGDWTMTDLYPYVTGYRDHIVKYDFSVVPDIIVLELGANDGSYAEIEYYNALKEFIEKLRAAYGPGIPIVWFGHNQKFCDSMKRYMLTVKSTDPDLYALNFAYGGSGSAALSTQSKGHPSAGEQQEIADKIYEFLQEKRLIE